MTPLFGTFSFTIRRTQGVAIVSIYDQIGTEIACYETASRGATESDESIDRAVIAYREIGEYAYDGEPESVEEEADYQDWRGR